MSVPAANGLHTFVEMKKELKQMICTQDVHVRCRASCVGFMRAMRVGGALFILVRAGAHQNKLFSLDAHYKLT